MEANYIKCGDCTDLLKQLPDKSIDMVITSPPYFNLRDYGANGQIGRESECEEYIENLLKVFREVHRVLKDSGSCWINIDDVYINQSLSCIPDKLKIRMTEEGFLCRNEIIWHKPNAMPSSAKTRFNNDFEKMFFFTKRNKYFFETQYEPAKTAGAKNTKSHKESKYKSASQEASVRQGMNKERGNNLVFLRKNLPKQKDFVDFMRNRTTIDFIVENSDLKKTKVEHWFRKDETGFSFPSVEDWNAIKWIVDDWSKEFQTIDEQLTDVTIETDSITKNAHKGRIKRAVWSINTKPMKEYHYAPFPEEFIKTPILACTEENAIVLDPFMGSGTTAIVCKKYNRRFIGFDINQEYVELILKRLQEGE